MSNLSGYDSEAVGFDSVSLKKRSESHSSTQTTEFGETGMASQTSLSKDYGSMATPEELNAQDDILREYPPPGLNEFLRRVVPAMMVQLDENRETACDSSDSDEEEVLVTKLFQDITLNDISGLGGGDQASAVLALSWSSAGNSLAVSVGKPQHESWCTHDGLVRVYTVRQTAGDQLVHALDINEKNCVSAVKYHPSVAALLAYGTTSGEVVICDLRTTSSNYMTLSSPSDCHGSKRVSALKWADAPLANTFLTIQITSKGKRRGASDQVLVSAGSDGTMNVWQVNVNMKTFENVVCYDINGSRKMAAPDITCFDFIKSYPLRPSDEKVADDVFVVGTKSGALFVCKIRTPQGTEADVVDPACEALEGHAACVLDVAFSLQKPGVFVSVSIDSQLRVYDIHQATPLKVCHVGGSVSCVSWLAAQPSVCALGTAGGGAGGAGGTAGGAGGTAGGAGGVVLYNAASGRPVPAAGLGALNVTAIDVAQAGTCRIACGDADSRVRVWELPTRRMRFAPDDYDF